MSSPDTRATFLRIAGEYEWVAEQAERLAR